jgi:hypothetical protein
LLVLGLSDGLSSVHESLARASAGDAAMDREFCRLAGASAPGSDFQLSHIEG